MISDGYVKYEEAEVHKSASMQDFEDNEKKMADLWPFWILFVLNLAYLSHPCVGHCFTLMAQHFFFCIT